MDAKQFGAEVAALVRDHVERQLAPLTERATSLESRLAQTEARLAELERALARLKAGGR
ncbi:hypothetical protein GRI89_04995 [Altererythrobacter salegens]|uniref:Uncharacterized protein n=1 Tax=Croceibacterium salegens TaxID=1737568 RepID=A0A6I4SVV2_9SPHN|nr:hypothetical protein [Croceibacterium salegens]MXO58896.1 hypothetical protein [Croceibacterium salegens]